MPIYNGNYAAPVWVNGVPPTIGATELEAMTGTAERSQVLHGSGAPGSGTAGEIGQLYADMSSSPVEFYRMTGVSAGGGFIWESEHDIEDNLTTTYDSSGTYAAGDFCLYGGLLYEAAVDILAPEEWTAAHWQGVTAADAETAHFARRDNPHEVTAAQAGLGNVENVLQYSASNPAIKRGTVALEGTWSGAASPYTKTITVTGPTVTAKSYVELQFTPAQMNDLMSRGVRSVHVYNNGGVLTAMAWGGVPGNMTAQCTVEELNIPEYYVKFQGNGSFTLATYQNSKIWPGSMEYSVDGLSWETWDGTTVLTSGSDNSIYLRGENNRYVGAPLTKGFYFGGNATEIYSDGDMECMRDWPTIARGEAITQPAKFQYLFKQVIQLVTAPKLSALSVAGEGYAGMFTGCASLIKAPELPALNLNVTCYSGMFSGCTSLRNAPALPAQILSRNCYATMFKGCTHLESAPALSATTLEENCYSGMFMGCERLADAPELPANVLFYSCYSQMFEGCTSLVNAPALPATTAARYCYKRMFRNCSSLTTAPALPATTLNYNCYEGMFSGCTSLVNAPTLPATTLAANCYTEMFRSCSGLTAPPVLPATNLTGCDSCYSGMFRGCTSLTAAPALPATTLAVSCYSNMFDGCESLTTPPVLPATVLSAACYLSMFEGCTRLAVAPELASTQIAASCYTRMFLGCTSLSEAPRLPAETLQNYCYSRMFYGCTGIKLPPVLPSRTLKMECYYGMFFASGITALPELPATVLAVSCYQVMFSGCTGIKMAASQDGEYTTPYSIPSSGTGTTASNALLDMFTYTGGTFTGTPTINTTYYTSNTVVPAT